MLEDCTKFGKLILRKIVATRCHSLKIKRTKFDLDYTLNFNPPSAQHVAPVENFKNAQTELNTGALCCTQCCR